MSLPLLRAASWKSEYDPILNQVYYVNLSDGSISFDLPCEVHQRKSSGFLTRISSKLSLRKSKSRDCKIRLLMGSPKAASLAVPHSELALSPASSYAPSSNSFLLGSPLSLSLPSEADDQATLSSTDSIQTFYSELPRNEIYYDYESLHYVDRNASVLYDKEQERLELRQQFRDELY